MFPEGSVNDAEKQCNNVLLCIKCAFVCVIGEYFGFFHVGRLPGATFWIYYTSLISSFINRSINCGLTQLYVLLGLRPILLLTI